MRNHQRNLFRMDRRAPRWEHDTAMLASSMMLVSISEDSPSSSEQRFKSRLSPSPRTDSGASLSGWGTAATRKSCKMDLCSLAAAAQDADMTDASDDDDDKAQQSRRPSIDSSTISEDNDQGGDWGFYEEAR
jgi:hypothetical protein